MARTGVFPGSFDPLTVAHVEIARLARETLDLELVELVVSSDPLGKDGAVQPTVTSRLRAIEEASLGPWLRARATAHRLLADMGAGHDVLILGADKWHQLHDESFYESASDMQRALARLPHLAVAPRADVALPPELGVGATVLALPDHLQRISSSAVRAGAAHWRV